MKFHTQSQIISIPSHSQLKEGSKNMSRKEAYKVLRLVRRVSSLGIGPVKLLSFSRLIYQHKGVSVKGSNSYITQKWKNKMTISFRQINLWTHAYRNLSDFNLPNDFGIFPSNLLPYKSMLMSFFKLPSSSGMFPLISFL